jgi:rubrerythrin
VEENPDSLEKPVLFRDAVVEMERAAAAFYRRIARVSGNPRHVEVLEFLAREEEDHARKMANLSRTSEAGPVLSKAFEDADRLLLFLLEGAREIESIASTLDSQEKVLILALKLEKDSILFYRELRAQVGEGELGAELEGVIEEESRHFRTFYDLLKLLRRSDSLEAGSSKEARRELRDAVDRDESNRVGEAGKEDS